MPHCFVYIPTNKAAYIHCGSNEILICYLLSAIVWQQRHMCDIAVDMCMLVSAYNYVSVIPLGHGILAKVRYTGINTGLRLLVS